MTQPILIIGAGINGLVAAAYLGKAGKKTLLVERRPIVGGAAITEEFHPGFRNSTASYTVSLLNPKVIADMDLARHGLRVVERKVSNFLPFDDGRYLLAGEAGTERWQKWLGWLWGLLLAYLAVVTAIGFAAGPAIMPWFEYLAMGNAGMLLMLALGGLAVLSWGAAVRRDGRWLERLTLMFCLLALSVDAADAAFDLALPFARDLALTFYAAAPAGLAG